MKGKYLVSVRIGVDRVVGQLTASSGAVRKEAKINNRNVAKIIALQYLEQ